MIKQGRFLKNGVRGLALIVGLSFGQIGYPQTPQMDLPNEDNQGEVLDDESYEIPLVQEDYKEQSQESKYPRLLEKLVDTSNKKLTPEEKKKAEERNYDILIMRSFYEDLDENDSQESEVKKVFEIIFTNPEDFDKKFLSTKRERENYDRFYPDGTSWNKNTIESRNELYREYFPWSFKVEEVNDPKNKDPLNDGKKRYYYFLNQIELPYYGFYEDEVLDEKV